MRKRCKSILSNMGSIQMKNKCVKEYYKKLKELFLNMNYTDGKYLRDFRLHLMEYAIVHPDCTYDELVEEFGTPKEIFCEYVGAQDPDYLISCINKKHFRKWMGTGIIAVGICCVFIWALFYYSIYKGSRHDSINREVVIIKDFDLEDNENEKE